MTNWNNRKYEAALEAVFGTIGFLPCYGWAVSGTYYLIAKPLYNYVSTPRKFVSIKFE